MTIDVIELARRAVVCDVLETGSVAKCWSVWEPLLQRAVGASPTADSILNLGSELSAIFVSTKTEGRGQDVVSGGGAAWEALVCYYLNLCLIGTHTVVFKKRKSVPLPVQDALTMSYRTVPTNTESDLVAVTFPDEAPALRLPLVKGEKLRDRLDQVADSYFHELAVTVVQCKTNWNDNAQIPMLWDMVYSARDFAGGRITSGRNNRHLENLRSFTYSFVTVPTNKLIGFKPKSTPVRRVSELSGGNYWGRDDMPGVARSLRQIFNVAGIGPEDGRGIIRSLSKALVDLRERYSYFKILQG